MNANDETYVEPDISVICDKNKLDDRGCNGAPDFIIEIVSPSSRKMDYSTKMTLYSNAGVREYKQIESLLSLKITEQAFNSSINQSIRFKDLIPS